MTQVKLKAAAAAAAFVVLPLTGHAVEAANYKLNPNVLMQESYAGSSATAPAPLPSLQHVLDNSTAISGETVRAQNAESALGTRVTNETTRAEAAESALGAAATNASNITSGTLSPSRLPNPGASTLGGVTSVTGSNVVVTGIPTNGTPTTAPFIGTTAGTARDAAAAIAAEGAAQATANAAPVTAWSGSGFGFGSVPSAVQVANTQNAPTQDTSGNYQATASDVFICVNLTSPAANTVTLPASPANGRPIAIKDCAGNSATYPITVVPASGTIDGQSSYVVNINFEEVDLVYTGSAWSVR
jgi:hypothetical protein